MTDRTCVICGKPNDHMKAGQVTCGDDYCIRRNKLEAGKRREALRVRHYRSGGEMRAIDRGERVRVLKELIRWSEVVEEAEARSEPAAARAAKKRVAECVDLLGFDPCVYVPDRSIEDAGKADDALGVIIGRRQQALLRAIPGTTSELAEAANVRSSDVRGYLKSYLDRGDVACRIEGRVTYWEAT